MHLCGAEYWRLDIEQRNCCKWSASEEAERSTSADNMLLCGIQQPSATATTASSTFNEILLWSTVELGSAICAQWVAVFNIELACAGGPNSQYLILGRRCRHCRASQKATAKPVVYRPHSDIIMHGRARAHTHTQQCSGFVRAYA